MPRLRVPATQTKTIRVAIADDHALLRAGLRKLLAAEPDLVVVGEAGDAPAIFELAQNRAPDVLLLDLKMPQVDGLEILRQLQGVTSPPRVLVLTASEDEDDLAQAMKLGASGIVLKSTTTDLLIQAIHKVAEGEIWIDGQITASLIKHLADPRLTGRSYDEGGLTPREREITTLVGQGYKYKEIAEMLSISEQTVKNHLRNIFHKLGVSDRLQLALYAIHHNL